jgi:hypothetical protein
MGYFLWRSKNWAQESSPNQKIVLKSFQKQKTVTVSAQNQQKSAKGTVFLDGGISNEEIRLKTYEYYNIEHKSSKSI